MLHWYSVDANGRFIYHHGARRLAKGSGKSPFAAVLCILEFLAPVRFDGFDEKQPGGCRAKPVRMPWVQIAAPAEAATENTMRMVRAFLPKEGELASAYDLNVGKQSMFLPPEGKLQVVTSSATTLEGAEATFCIGDETEHWTASNGGGELAATISDNLAKSGSRMVETNNAWKPGIGTVAESTFEAWAIQQEGKSQNSTHILYDARIAPPDTDMADPAELRSALEFVYANCPWADLDAIVSRIYDARTAPDDARRKYLNQPTTSDDRWVAWQEWATVARPHERVARGETITLGFDGSLKNDATALIGCRVSDGHVFTVGLWETGGDEVPVDEVNAVVERTFDNYDVKAFFCDVAYWESYVKVTWPRQFGTEVRTWAKRGGKDPQPFAYDLRGNVKEWTLEVELTQREVIDQQLTHDDHPALSRHVINAVTYPNRFGSAIRKETPGSPHKIDAAVTMILARMARRRYLAETAGDRQRSGRVV